MAYTVTDLVGVADGATGVVSKLANRTDLATNKAPQAISDAIQEFTQDYPFTELQVIGANIALTAGTNSYNWSAFTTSPDTDVAQVITFFRYYDTVGGSTSQGGVLKYRTPPTISSLMQTSGLPQYWTRVGGKILLAPNPDKAYIVFLHYQRYHPFSQPVAVNDPILLPNEWRELVEYAASERLAANERMLDYVKMYHDILYGDPEFQMSGGSKGRPGLIFGRSSSRERNASSAERQLQPVVGKYTGR